MQVGCFLFLALRFPVAGQHAGQGRAEPVIGVGERLRQNAGLADHGHEVIVATPARHDVGVQMRDAAKKFEFERAAALRDRIRTLKQRDLSGFFSAAAEPAPVE